MLGVLCVAAALLVLGSGAAKIRTPRPAATMIVTVLPATARRGGLLAPAVRVIGGVEMTVAALFLVLGGRVPAALLAACYLGFTVVALRLVTAGRPVACGCFGAASDAPVGAGHVVLDVLGLGVGGAAVVAPLESWGGLTDHSSAVAGGLVLQAVLLAWLGYLAITALPALSTARRRLDPALESPSPESPQSLELL